MKTILKITTITVLLSLFAFMPRGGSSLTFAKSDDETLSLFHPSDVKHFFTHALVAYPEIAFDKNNSMRTSYLTDCLTVSEFKEILLQLYNNDYALVDVSAVYKTENGVTKPCDFYFPHNKKPIIISFDDINYYQKKMNLGMNDKLIVSNGTLATFTQNAEPQINYDNETITVLQNFITTHPDFSYNGAKGIICLTGYDGILGWRTQKNSENQAEEIIGAKQVVDALKANGWRFASHSYGHGHMQKMTEQAFLSDVNSWKSEVEPLVGKTDLYCYPYGEWEIAENGKFSAKHNALQTAGFNLFFGVGTAGYYGTAPFSGSDRTLIMDRLPLDGYSLLHFTETYAPYFDCKAVYCETEREI